MYKVLLVDDEILDLKGVHTFIPWTELGMEVVDAVTNGFAAYDVIVSTHIDILVTDIQMPSMTGLELFEKALETRKDLRAIFISGHQDFAYVKQALSLKACSYVLKPTDDNELIESLIQVKGELDLQREQNKTEETFREIMPVAKNQYLLKLFDGKLNEESIAILKHEYGMDTLRWPARAAVIQLDDLPWSLNTFSEYEKLEWIKNFYEKVFSLCQESHIQHVCEIDEQCLTILLDSTVDLSILHQLVERIKNEFPFSITIGLGGDAGEMGALQQSYREGLAALEYKMFQGKGKVIEFKDVASISLENEKSLLDVQLDALLDAMSHYELVQIHDEIDNLFKAVYRLSSKLTVRNFALYIIMKLDEHLHTLNEDLFEMLGLDLENLDIIFKFETISDIRSWLRRRVFELSEMLHVKKANKNYHLIHGITAYINERLHENISLRDVANQFSFTPNYLGHLFKEETGSSFTDYLIEQRMERARVMLLESKLKIYEIAEKVGYRYVPYFSRHFKEIYGMTPLEFRKNG